VEGGHQLINFDKRRRLVSVIKEIVQYQQKPYCLESVPLIQKFLENLEWFDEDTLFRLSYFIEERQGAGGPPPMSTTKRSKSNPKQRVKVQSGESPRKETPKREFVMFSGFKVEDKREWKFFDNDTESNIQVNEEGQVVAATIPKLVERLTHHQYSGSLLFLSAFLTFIFSRQSI